MLVGAFCLHQQQLNYLQKKERKKQTWWVEVKQYKKKKKKKKKKRPTKKNGKLYLKNTMNNIAFAWGKKRKLSGGNKFFILHVLLSINAILRSVVKIHMHNILHTFPNFEDISRTMTIFWTKQTPNSKDNISTFSEKL